MSQVQQLSKYGFLSGDNASPILAELHQAIGEIYEMMADKISRLDSRELTPIGLMNRKAKIGVQALIDLAPLEQRAKKLTVQAEIASTSLKVHTAESRTKFLATDSQGYRDRLAAIRTALPSDPLELRPKLLEVAERGDGDAFDVLEAVRTDPTAALKSVDQRAALDDLFREAYREYRRVADPEGWAAAEEKKAIAASFSGDISIARRTIAARTGIQA